MTEQALIPGCQVAWRWHAGPFTAIHRGSFAGFLIDPSYPLALLHVIDGGGQRFAVEPQYLLAP